MFAIFSNKGKQYKVTLNVECDVELLGVEPKSKVTFSEVLLFSDENKTILGQPIIPGATIEAEVVNNSREDKTKVFKFHSKKRYKRTFGHRQGYTKVKILKINLNDKK